MGPTGPARGDYQAGQICATLAGLHNGQDFDPDGWAWRPPPPRPRTPQRAPTPDQIRAKLEAAGH